MAVRSKRLFAPTSMAAGAVVLYTCPSGETAIIKSVVLRNIGAVACTFTVGIQNTGVSAFLVETVPAGGVLVWEGWLIVPAGSTINGLASVASANNRISAHGTELEGIAD